MKTSCIQHPKMEPLVIIREWQLEVCDGNACAAALLSFFEYWHNIRLEMAAKSQKANEVAEVHGDKGMQDASLWQFHSEDDLETGVLVYKRDTISTAIKFLVQKGFVEVGRNPNPRYKFDRTRHFRFNPAEVNKWLSQRAPKSRSSSPENPSRSTENQGRSPESRSAIPEITSETTPEGLDSFSLRSKGGMEEIKPALDGKRKSKSKADPEVEAVYECYPRKEARGSALKAIEGALGRLADGEGGQAPMSRDEALMYLARRVGEYARSPAGNNGRFTPHPATWFNQSRYFDDGKEWSRENGQQQQTFEERRQQQARKNIVAGLGFGDREVPRHSGIAVEDTTDRGRGVILEGTTRALPGGKS